MFKEYKKTKIKILIAKLEGEINVLERVFKEFPDPTSYYIDKLVKATSELTAAKKHLEIIEN